MIPLVPFIVSVVGAAFADQQRQKPRPNTESCGALGTGPTSVKVAPTRFTAGTALAMSTVAARGKTIKNILGKEDPDKTRRQQEKSKGHVSKKDEAEKAAKQAKKAVDELIKKEFVIDRVSDDVVNDMGVGEWNEDLDEGDEEDEDLLDEEEDPQDEEDEDRDDEDEEVWEERQEEEPSEEYGARRRRSAQIFDPISGFGIRKA